MPCAFVKKEAKELMLIKFSLSILQLYLRLLFLVSRFRQSSILVSPSSTWAVYGVVSHSGSGVTWDQGSRSPTIETGKMSLADLSPELLLLTQAPVVKAAGKPEAPVPFALSHILFRHLEWPPSKPSLVQPNGRHPACPSGLNSTTTSRKPSLTCCPAPPTALLVSPARTQPCCGARAQRCFFTGYHLYAYASELTNWQLAG